MARLNCTRMPPVHAPNQFDAINVVIECEFGEWQERETVWMPAANAITWLFVLFFIDFYRSISRHWTNLMNCPVLCWRVVSALFPMHKYYMIVCNWICFELFWANTNYMLWKSTNFNSSTYFQSDFNKLYAHKVRTTSLYLSVQASLNDFVGNCSNYFSLLIYCTKTQKKFSNFYMHFMRIS